MTNINLLEVNVDKLFEQNNVADIDAINKKIQGVIEEKREELRTMVGERYRDLLKAADTITEMQDSSGDLISQIENITTNCRILNEQQLIGFKTHDAEDLLKNRQANKQLNSYFSTMVQIKLLISLPELIWSHLDEKHFYRATELFIFSRHISTGLQLDAGNTLMQKLPIAKKQWEMLKPFQITIRNYIVKALESENLSVDMAVDCLLSLVLLEKIDLNGILNIFLKLRVTAFSNCLKETQLYSEQPRRRVKDRIVLSLKVLNGTIDLLSNCFMEKSVLFERLRTLADSNTAPTITLMEGHDSKYAYILPEIISNFKPKIDLMALNKEKAVEDIELWVKQIDSIISSDLKQLADLIPNLKTIHEIKIEANNFEKHFNFQPFVEEYQINVSLAFYEEKFSPLLSQRVQNIVKDYWSKAIDTTFNSLKEFIETIDQLEESNIWSDVASDLPLSLAEALSEDFKIKRLLMKTKGYGPGISSLCSEFDGTLKDIIDEINILLFEESTKVNDKLVLVDFLREHAELEMTEFLTKVKGLDLNCKQRAELLFVVRACAALIELCPHLKICFCQQSSWRQWIDKSSSQNIEHWLRFCRLYEEEILRFWQKLVDGLLEEHHCSKYLMERITQDGILSDFTLWEMVTLDEKDEQDNAVKSTFRIPKQPSISLQTYLFGLIRELNQSIPQTMPTKVLNYFNNKLLTQILKHYQQHTAMAKAERNEASSNQDPEMKSSSIGITSTTSTNTFSAATAQNVALQLYFDLKFLQNIFNISREDRTLVTHFSEVQNAFKDMIDPFDFELFAEHISANVKRSVLRLNCALGVLTPTDTTSSSTSTGATTTVTTSSLVQEKEPNVLSLSSCGSTSLWFPLLPIVTANTMNTEGNLETRKSTAETEKSTTPTKQKATGGASTTATRKSDTTKSKSFFEAMSQEWFR